jgi:hypothetical protein
MKELIEAIAQQKTKFVCKHTGKELLLIPLKDNVADFNQYLVLNELGAFIWEQIDAETSLSSLQEAVFNEFDAPLEQIEQDLEKFIPTLHQYTCVK